MNKNRNKFGTVSQFFVPVLFLNMPIVTLSDALIQRLAANDRRILRDRVLSGFCLRLNKRTRTFLVATTAAGKQIRITIGRWPLFSTDEARAVASELLRDCRKGKFPMKLQKQKLPTLREILQSYAKAKNIKLSSLKRYESLLKIHFGCWQDISIGEFGSAAFSEACHEFAQTRGAALVETGKALIGAVIKYVNAIYNLRLKSPFNQLAAAGLMPKKSAPRVRRLQEEALPEWYTAVQGLQEKQRDLLMLLAMTGLRRNEGATISKQHIDFDTGTLHIPETKTGQSHSLPITSVLQSILARRVLGLHVTQMLFEGVSPDHLAEMASRAGAPNFMLHDLRKMLATIGERIGCRDAVLRRILNHKAKRSDTLHRHYVSVSVKDIREPLERIQFWLLQAMGAKLDDS